MKIGVFDSGLGGLLITRSLTYTLPEYDYLYLGDTAHLPYGNRSQESIYQLTRRAVLYLCKEGCGLIIIACNTASAEALRRIQQYDIPAAFPDRRVLGVLVPAAEAAVTAAGQHGQIGILATASTVRSGAYLREIQKLAPAMIIRQQEAPLLVPLIENNEPEQIEPVLNRYLEPLIA
ncbi:aspartate/glutamate racemase family protein, partial [Patescibacteria group bacterium]|nr:aspartate/glutamate racemase family protein [Patescibacteria group bacterium]